MAYWQSSLCVALALSGALTFLPLCSVHAMHSPAGFDMQQQPFGQTREGLPVTLYTLSNGAGMRASVIDYGATLASLVVPDRCP